MDAQVRGPSTARGLGTRALESPRCCTDPPDQPPAHKAAHAAGGCPFGLWTGPPPDPTAQGHLQTSKWRLQTQVCPKPSLPARPVAWPEGRGFPLRTHLGRTSLPPVRPPPPPRHCPSTRTRASGRNSLFLRIFLNTSVSSSLASSSSLVPASGAASAPASPCEAGPGSGVSMVGSSACSMSHSMAWGTDMLQGKTASEHRCAPGKTAPEHQRVPM